jgi:type 1 glutamine amidotransferase
VSHTTTAPTRCHLVCGGTYHDFDYVRLRLLTLLAERSSAVRVSVAQDYSDTEAIRAADFVISYTCDVRPTVAQAHALEAAVTSGSRWLALHGSNAVTVPIREGLASPSLNAVFDGVIGSLFAAHPPVGPFEVRASTPQHPLVAGITPFTARDELFLMDVEQDAEPLLEATFLGVIEGVDRPNWTTGDGRRTIMYRRSVGRGVVVYLALGHCHGPHDGHPGGGTERGSWELPEFSTLLRRCVQWGVDGD